jgi:hypothetical protein
MLLYNHPANDLQLMDRRLIEIFGEEQCLKWKKESPVILDYQAFELVNGHFISALNDYPVAENELEPLESFDPVNFPVDELLNERSSFINPNRYNIKRQKEGRKHYLIGATNHVLVLLSGEELRVMFGK